MTSAKIYARANIDDARPNERAFRVIRYYDHGGWVIEASSAKGKWEKVCTRYTLSEAIHLMDRLASAAAKSPIGVPGIVALPDGWTVCAFIGKSQRRPLFLPRQLHTNASDGRRGNRQCPGETREALMPRISFNHVKVAHVFVAPLETDVYRRRHCSHFQIAPSASPV